MGMKGGQGNIAFGEGQREDMPRRNPPSVRDVLDRTADGFAEEKAPSEELDDAPSFFEANSRVASRHCRGAPSIRLGAELAARCGLLESLIRRKSGRTSSHENGRACRLALLKMDPDGS